MLASVSDKGQLDMTHMPFMCEEVEPDVQNFSLISHFAKDNPHWRNLVDGQEVCVVFQGPHAYVSPQWYSSAVNAPTWNYLVAHVYGSVRLITKRDELLSLMECLVVHFESKFANPSGINLEPERMERLMGRIVGLRLGVTRVEEKAQLNQNRSIADQQGVAQMLSQNTDPRIRLLSDEMRANISQAND